MSDLRISELLQLAGSNLAAGDFLPVADVSASETRKITVTDFFGNASTLIADATIPSAKILFTGGSIPGSALQGETVNTSQIANDAISAAKLGNNSSVRLVTTLPASGDFVGQIALDTDDLKIYCWNGSVWLSIKAAGSVNTIVGGDAGVVNVTTSQVGDTVTINTTLDNTAAAAQFLAGPSSGAGAVAYRAIVGADLPAATTTEKGAVVVNGNGLAMSGNQLVVDNTVTANTSEYHLTRYNAKGLVTAGRSITAADLPPAAAGTLGAVYPGGGLTVDSVGELGHSNAVSAGSGAKITFDAQGHVTGTLALEAADIPDLPATKLTTGTLSATLFPPNGIEGGKLGNYSVTQIGGAGSTAGVVIFPTADHYGQFFYDSLNGDLYLYDGNAWQPITITAGEIILAGTYNANTNQVASVTTAGSAIGLTVGSALPSAAETNNRYYLIVSVGGTGTAPAPTVALAPPDIILSNGTTWEEIDVSTTVTAQQATNVNLNPQGSFTGSTVQAALEELLTDKAPKASPTFTTSVTLNNATLVFDTSGTFNTTLSAAANNAADRTITVPALAGTMLVSGNANIVNADISASAAIAYSKLALSGSIVNADIGASAAIAYSKLALTGNVVNADIASGAAIAYTKLSLSNSIVNADIASGAAVAYSKLALSNSIVNADISSSAAIADTKLATISTAGKVSGGAITSGTIAGSTAINTSGAIATSSTLGVTGEATLKEIKETVYSLTGTSIDPANGTVQYKSLSGNTTFTEALESGQSVLLRLENGSSYTVTWPTITWVSAGGNSAPTLTAKDVLVFWKISTTLYGAYAGSYV